MALSGQCLDNVPFIGFPPSVSWDQVPNKPLIAAFLYVEEPEPRDQRPVQRPEDMPAVYKTEL